MKYFLRILLILVLAVATVTGAYYYTNSGELTSSEKVSLTTVSKAPVTEKGADKILVGDYDEGFKLYKQGDIVILDDGDSEYEFDDWSEYIDLEEPKLYYYDFDSDDKKELVFKIVSAVDDDGSYEHELYYLDKTTSSSGKKKYVVSLLSRNLWRSVFNDELTEEMTQLKECEKIVQFAMRSSDYSIQYDEKTGKAKNTYTGYFACLKNEKTGEYYKPSKWWLRDGEVYVSKKGKKHYLSVKVYINVSYEGTDEVQQPGYIYFNLEPKEDKGGMFGIAEGSMGFKGTGKYKVSPRHNIANEDWTIIRNNSNTSSYSSGDKVIDSVSYDVKDVVIADLSTVDFSESDNEISNCSSVKLTSEYVEFTAKKGYTFDEDLVETRNFSVVTNVDEKGIYAQNEISYEGKIYENDDGCQVLRITFDKAYPRGEIHMLRVSIPSNY